MEEPHGQVHSPARANPSPEETMMREDVPREALARLGRGEAIKGVARGLGVDRKTVKQGRERGGWPTVIGDRPPRSGTGKRAGRPYHTSTPSTLALVDMRTRLVVYMYICIHKFLTQRKSRLIRS